MRLKTKAIGTGLALVAMLGTMVAQPMAVRAAVCSVSTVVTSTSGTAITSIAPGANFDVHIQVTTDSATRGMQYILNWDPSLVTCNSFTAGTFYSASYSAYLTVDPSNPLIDNTNGRFPKDTSIPNSGFATRQLIYLSGGPAGGPTGTGDVYVLHMTAKAGVSGSDTFTLTRVLLSDATADANNMNPTVNNGQVTIQAAAAVPTISGISPTSGASGSMITITGTNFISGATVSFNGTAASNVNVVSATSITATVPNLGSNNVNNVSITVTTSGGASSANTTFSYTAAQAQPPTVTGVNPTSGTPGTTVTISGTNFVSGATVKFNTANSGSVSVTNSTTLTATVPDMGGGTLNNVGITVTTSGGTSASYGGFTYSPPPAPTVTGVSPTSASSGAAVTISGTNFVAGANSTTVSFNGIAGTGVSVTSATSLTVTVPSLGASAIANVSIIVTTSGGSSSSYTGFSYTGQASVSPPTIGSISPTFGGEGTTLTITGTNFVVGATTVKFIFTTGSNITVTSSTSLTVQVPDMGAIAINGLTLYVTNSAGTATTTFNYTGTQSATTPTITGISPPSGGSGSTITITGTNFVSGATVSFNGTAGGSVTVVNATSITTTVPNLGTANISNVAITVTTSAGTSSANSGFSYVTTPPPTVTGVSPISAAKGAAVTLTGTNFISGATVSFNGKAASGVSVTNDTTITVTVPDLGASDVSGVSVTVTTTGGTSAPSTSFSYLGNQTPTITGISPSSGGTGTTVTITGTNFVAGATVSFNTAFSINVSVTSPTTLTATVPNLGTSDISGVTIAVTTLSGNATSTTFSYTKPITTTLPPTTPMSTTSANAALTPYQSFDFSGVTDTTGLFTSDLTKNSSFGQNSLGLSVKSGTRGLEENGNPLTGIEVYTPSNPPAAPANTRTMAVFDIGPSGTTFSTPIQFGYQYNQNQLASGERAHNIYLAYYNTQDKKWEPCQYTLDTQNRWVIGEISHLSLYAVMVKTNTGLAGVISSIRGFLSDHSQAEAIIVIGTLIAILIIYLLLRRRGSYITPADRAALKSSQGMPSSMANGPSLVAQADIPRNREAEGIIWDDILKQGKARSVSVQTHFEIIGGKVLIPRDGIGEVELVNLTNNRVQIALEYNPEAQPNGSAKITILGPISEYKKSKETEKCEDSTSE